jgi:hypothetical protein
LIRANRVGAQSCALPLGLVVGVRSTRDNVPEAREEAARLFDAAAERLEVVASFIRGGDYSLALRHLNRARAELGAGVLKLEGI